MASIRDRIESAVSVVIGIAAVVVAVTAVMNTVRARAIPTVRGSETKFEERWEQYLSYGSNFGDKDAPVSIIEFVDFECPGCRGFERAFSALPPELSAKTRLTLIHFPLDYHRFAPGAGLAFECAAAQGRANEMRSMLFELQDSLGLLDFDEIARRVSVADLSAFRTCVEERHPAARLDSGRVAGERMGLAGTPTILINGWRLGFTPNASQLKEIVEGFAEGRTPSFDK